jgi:hypothetical protein
MSAVSAALAHPYLLGFGAALLLLGSWLWRWSGRHDLKGMAVDAAWQVAKARGDLRARTDLGDKLKDLAAEKSNVGRATKAAGYAVRHAVAQVASVGSLVCLLAGAALVAAAFWIG